MKLRTCAFEDWRAVKQLYASVSQHQPGIARLENEITDEYVQRFTKKSIDDGLMIVGEHPEKPEELIAEIHAYRSPLQTFRHVMTDLTLVVHPDFQGKKIGRTIFTIFLEEIGLHKPDIGKVELFTRESNLRAINLYQSLGFRIEGRMEMRVKTQDGNYEADIPMGWQNPNFQFD